MPALLDELLKVRQEREQLYAQFSAWGSVLIQIGKAFSGYTMKPLRTDASQYPTFEQIQDAVARYAWLVQKDGELYDQLPEELQKQLKLPAHRQQPWP